MQRFDTTDTLGVQTPLNPARKLLVFLPQSFGRIMFAIILGVLLGSIFWQVKYDTVAGVASRTGMIYISVVFYSVRGIPSTSPSHLAS